MEILSKCIDQREKLYRANDDFRANLFCQLGKHTWFRSQQLEKKGNTKKADILWKEALQVMEIEWLHNFQSCRLCVFNGCLLLLQAPDADVCKRQASTCKNKRFHRL